MSYKTKKILRFLPTVVVACIISVSAFFKLTGMRELVLHFTEIGIVSYLKILGITELVFLLLFLYPKTIQIGFLLLTAYYGGAIATELPHGSFIIGPLIILSLIWIAAFLRYPLIFINSIQEQPVSKNPIGNNISPVH